VNANGSTSGPFTTTPLSSPNGVAPPAAHGPQLRMGEQQPASMNDVVPLSMPIPDTSISPAPPVPIPIPPSAPSTGPGHTSESPIIIVDDVDADGDEEPALKRRRLDGQGGAVAV